MPSSKDENQHGEAAIEKLPATQEDNRSDVTPVSTKQRTNCAALNMFIIQ